MLRLLGIMISIGLADSLNPSTLAAAMYLAIGHNARDELIKFTAGVFCVYFVGGLFLAFGPGKWLISLIPKPRGDLAAWLEIAAGVLLIVGAWYLISRRHHLRQKKLPGTDPSKQPKTRRSFLLGAGIMLFELPTALPAFAVVAAIDAADPGRVNTVILLAVFNVCFIVPLLAMIAVLWFAGDSAADKLARTREFVEHHWPLVLGIAALLAGAFVIALGATGIGSTMHNGLGHFSRRLHHDIPH